MSPSTPNPPRFATPRTPSRPTHGAAVAVIAEALGQPLMPWQRHVADVATELLPDGSFAYPVVVVTVQRQAGKTTLVDPVCIETAMTVATSQQFFTAQTRQDARDTFMEGFGAVVEQSVLGSRVKVRRSNGSEGMHFPNRSTFRVFAPTPAALHGKATHRVVVDEGWAFDGTRGLELEQAIMPTFTTTGGQLWIVSAAGTAESAWLAGWIERGRAAVDAGRTAGVAYFEWSLPDSDRAAVLDGLDAGKRDPADPAFAHALELVLAAHPAAGYTLRLDALRAAAEAMRPGEFLRAYGNVPTESAERLIPAAAWEAARAKTLAEGGQVWAPPTRVALGFDVALDRSRGWIVAAWHDGNRLRVDVVAEGPGVSWMPGRMMELRAKWRPVGIGHNGGPALDVADQLARAGVALSPDAGLGTRDYLAACSSMLQAIVDVRLEHRSNAALDAAVTGASRREVGDGWAWDRRHSAAPIGPLVAATAAAWVLDHAPRPLPKPQFHATRRRVVRPLNPSVV